MLELGNTDYASRGILPFISFGSESERFGSMYHESSAMSRDSHWLWDLLVLVDSGNSIL